MTVAAERESAPHPGMGFAEFVALIAAVMALNALAIDSMLPGLPQIASALGVEEPNRRQWIVTAYLLGFGAAQLPYGPLADRFGRKPVLLFGLALYTAASFAAAAATSFDAMLAWRVVQGVGAAATRVLAVSIVRDCYAGRTMAKVMSLTFIVFLAAPIVAPALGQAILLVAPWPWIFAGLGLIGALFLGWTALRLPETLAPENRRPVALGPLLEAYRLTLTSRVSAGYTLAMTLTLGALFGFITSAQQVFADALGAEKWFAAVFALGAAGMAVSAFLNARFVERLGTRRVSHAALLGFVAFAAIHLTVALAGLESLATFTVLQSAMLFCFGLVGSNFGAMAMEPLGRVAGVAASVQGFVTTVGGAVVGGLIGQAFDGTVVPLTAGFTLCGLLALVVVLWTEQGRLFTPRIEPAR